MVLIRHRLVKHQAKPRRHLNLKAQINQSVCFIHVYFNLLGEGSSASKPKKRTAPADGDDNNTIKRTRTTYTRYQLRILEHHYISCRYPDTQDLEDLVQEIRIPKKKVQVRKINILK